MTSEFKSDQFVISVGSGTADWIDEAYDGKDGFGEGVFQKASGDLEGAQSKEQDVYLIDTSHADFATFKTGFVDDYTQWRDDPEANRKEIPKEADILTLLENLEHPEKYTVHLPAGSSMTDFLKSVFKEDTLKDEGEYELSTKENKHREIVLTFNRNSITESQLDQLEVYVTLMPNDEKETLQKYGPDYLNLYRFAKEQIEKPTEPEATDQATDIAAQTTEVTPQTTKVPTPPKEITAQADFSYILDRPLEESASDPCEGEPKYKNITISHISGMAELRVSEGDWGHTIITILRELADPLNDRSFTIENRIEVMNWGSNYGYAQTCDQDGDGVYDIVVKDKYGKRPIRLISDVDWRRPLGAGLVNEMFWGLDPSIRVFPDEADSSCNLTYVMDYYADSDFPPEMAAAYKEGINELTAGEFKTLLGRTFRRGKGADLGGSNKGDTHVSLTLGDMPGLIYNKEHEIIYKFGYDFIHGKVIYRKGNKLPYFIIDTEQGGYLVFTPQKPSRDSKPGNLCLVDRTSPFHSHWISGVEEEKVQTEPVHSEVELEEDDPIALDELPPVITTTPVPTASTKEEKVFFETDKATVTAIGKASLSKAYELTQSKTEEGGEIKNVEVQGHTDDQGSHDYNQKLSERRAESVKKELVSLGIPSHLITTVGYGETRRLVENVTKKGREINRRVELKITMVSVSGGIEKTETFTVIASGTKDLKVEYEKPVKEEKKEDEEEKEEWIITGNIIPPPSPPPEEPEEPEKPEEPKEEPERPFFIEGRRR